VIVILCDGSSRGNPGPSSIGVVAWDRSRNSKIILPNYRYCADIGIKTSMQAEWSALIAGMRFANKKDRKAEKYIFSDSKTVVNQAKGYWRIKHKNTKLLYLEFMELKQQVLNFKISWIPRQLIHLADRAAKTGGINEMSI